MLLLMAQTLRIPVNEHTPEFYILFLYLEHRQTMTVTTKPQKKAFPTVQYG